SSENPNKQSFSSLMFLEPGEPRRVLAKNLQYLLLLALRIGFLVLLVLAFAGPTCFRVPPAAGESGARHHLIVLDASASLGYGNRWNQARSAAREVVADLELEDVAQVIRFGRTAEILTRPSGDAAVLRAAIDTAQPSVFRVDFGQLSSALDGVMRTAELPVVVHVITDAQASGVPSRFADLAPRQAATIDIVDIAGGAREDNWAIASFGGSPITGELQASVRGYAVTEATRTLQLMLEDAVIDQQSVVVPAGGTVSVDFEPLTLRAGSNRVSVRLAPGDELAADDTRYLALQRPEPRPVLILSSDLRGADALFTTAALDTLTALVIEPTVVGADALQDLDLNDFRFVIATDAGGLAPDAAARLSDYVESGGALLLGLGPATASLANVPVTEQVISPAGLGGRSDAVSIGFLDAGHPALRGVSSLRAARFYRYLDVEPASGDSVLIGLESGAPLLIERAVGDGRVLTYTSTLDRQWNDVVVQPDFVPFISGLANHLLGTAGFTSEAPLGSVLGFRRAGAARGQVFDPQGDVALALGGTDDVILDQIGYYEVVSNGISRFVAVNFDTRESDLRAMEPATLQRWEALGAPSETAGAAVSTENRAPEPFPLGWWILLMLVGVIIVESWVGNWHLRVQRGVAS
ncbi:MAG: VWA domain-containing protein, partial [Gammaproteobacteria bacterium]